MSAIGQNICNGFVSNDKLVEARRSHLNADLRREEINFTCKIELRSYAGGVPLRPVGWSGRLVSDASMNAFLRRSATIARSAESFTLA